MAHLVCGFPSLPPQIPWAEPEQLAPGYEQRLRELAAAEGYHLAAVYVRRGCVELTMVLEEQQGVPRGFVGGKGRAKAARASARIIQPRRQGMET
jgi:hypothetical protein